MIVLLGASCYWGEGGGGDSLELFASADYEKDGDVDAADLSLWCDNFATEGSRHDQGDANGDSLVDGADFLAWQRQLHGQSAASIAIVPEAGADSLALIAIGGITSARRRWRLD